METTVTKRQITHAEGASVSPRNLLLNIGDQMCEALLVAAAEGVTRFVASAPAARGGPGGDVPSAIALLTDQAGIPLAADDVEAVIVRGRPLRLSVVGEQTEQDRAALRSVERDGTARPGVSPDAAPRGGPRMAEWVRNIVEPFDRGADDALILLLPGGALPAWAADLMTALHAPALRPDRHIIVVASDIAIAAALPTGAVLLVRDDALPRALGDALTSIRARRLARGLAAATPALSFVQAAAAGVALARREGGETLVYLEVSEGSTVLVAHPLGVEWWHDAECDAAAGAATLLHRVGAEEVARWIPFPTDAAALRAWAVRRAAAPGALLTDQTDRTIAGGFARAALRALIARSDDAHPAPDRCILGPSFLRYEAPANALLAVADILRAPRAVDVAADPDDLLPVVGYLALSSPESARSLLREDALAPLGTLIVAPSSGPRRESPVAALLDGEAGPARTALAPDALTALPAATAGAVRLIRRDGHEETIAANGGPHGLLIDTRARPLRRGAGAPGTRGSVSDRLRPALAGGGETHA